MGHSLFDHMARLVLVRDLQTPLGPALDAGQASTDAWELLMEAEGYDPMDRVSLVFRDGDPVGCITLDTIDTGKKISACMEAVEPGSVLSSETSALEAVELLATTQWPFFFVLEHNRITGTFCHSDLSRLPFRLCLFALTLHLEESALNLLLRSPSQSWKALPRSRQEQAEAVYERRHGHAPDRERKPLDELLGCTMFCDKGTMLRKGLPIGGVRKSAIGPLFGRAEKIRNACAHAKAEQGLRDAVPCPRRLYQFIRDVQAFVDTMEQVQ